MTRVIFGKVTEVDDQNYTYKIQDFDGNEHTIYANLELKVQPGDTVMLFGGYIKDENENAYTENAVFKIDKALAEIGSNVFAKSDEIFYGLRGAFKERTAEENEELIDELGEDEVENEPEEEDEEFEGGEDDA